MRLREYQQKLINDIKNTFKEGKKSVCAVLGCGGGKSVIQASIAKSVTDKNKIVLYLVHRKELCEQIKQTFENFGVDMDLCFIYSIQTFKRLQFNFIDPYLILVDEAHTNLKAYKEVFEKYKCLKLGFTATPIRLKEKGLGELFEELVQSVSVEWLIDNKFLAPFKYFSIPLINLDDLNTKNADFSATDLQSIMENKIIYKDSVKQWLKFAKGKKTMVYCSTVQSSKEVAKEFQNEGIKAIHLDGKTDKIKREKTIKDFRDNKIQVICNSMLFSEGYDDKDIECILLLRPTKSYALHTQQAMRGMRYKEGKISIIIDCVGNVYRFGLPSQENKWSLETKQTKKENEIKIKECKQCLATLPIQVKFCHYCNFEFSEPKTPTKSKEVVQGDLIEIDKDFKLSQLRLRDFRAETWEEVENFRRVKKYNFLWSLHFCIKNNIKIPHKYNELKRRIKA